MIEICCEVGRKSQEGCPALERSERSLLTSGNTRCLPFWFLVRYAVTQLATQLQQRCIQVVCSNKEARKRLTELNGTPTVDLAHFNVVLK